MYFLVVDKKQTEHGHLLSVTSHYNSGLKEYGSEVVHNIMEFFVAHRVQLLALVDRVVYRATYILRLLK